MASSDPQTLASGATCIECNIPVGMQLPVLISLFAQIANVSTDPATLVDGARCIECNIPPGMYLPVLIYLATQITGGGGGGGNAQLVTYTAGTPANPSNLNQPAIAYDPNFLLPNLNWDPIGHVWG